MGFQSDGSFPSINHDMRSTYQDRARLKVLQQAHAREMDIILRPVRLLSLSSATILDLLRVLSCYYIEEDYE